MTRSRNKKIMKNTKLVHMEQIKYMSTTSPRKKRAYAAVVSLSYTFQLASRVAATAACKSTFGIVGSGQCRNESEPECALQN